MKDSVLVLNANFQPINVCSTRRAIMLVYGNKASIIKNGRGYIYTIKNSYPKPSIIRLERMVVRPRLKVKFSRQEVFRRDNYTCQYCGKKNVDLTLDHIFPRKLGGKHTWTNVITACITCNRRKGCSTPEQADMHILRSPMYPPVSASYYFQNLIERYSDWEEFIIGW